MASGELALGFCLPCQKVYIDSWCFVSFHGGANKGQFREVLNKRNTITEQ